MEAKDRLDYREARLNEPTVQPVYPPRALAARAGWATVGVRITVDGDGRVSDIAPSLLTLSTPGPFADDFQAAVEVAVRQWRFRPAEIIRLEKVETPDVTYNRVASRERVETHFDLAFTFTASGGVQ